MVVRQGSAEDAVPQRLLRMLRRICTREGSGLAAVRAQYLRGGGAFAARHTAEAPPAMAAAADARRAPSSGSVPPAPMRTAAPSASAGPATATTGGSAGRGPSSRSHGGFEAALSLISTSDRIDQLQARPLLPGGCYRRPHIADKLLCYVCQHNKHADYGFVSITMTQTMS